MVMGCSDGWIERVVRSCERSLSAVGVEPALRPGEARGGVQVPGGLGLAFELVTAGGLAGGVWLR